jgi:hypothetical protein
VEVVEPVRRQLRVRVRVPGQQPALGQVLLELGPGRLR